MRNRQIQEERIKTYFLDAAKNLLRAEGLKGVSVRNVAYRAGYSYATLYNYFKDINDLLFRCVEDFCQEVGDFVAARTERRLPWRRGFAACCRVCCCSTRTGSPPTITRSSCSRSMRSSAG